MDFKTINLGRKHIGEKEMNEVRSELWETALEERTITALDVDRHMVQIENQLNNLHFIVSFGRGFWAGALDEYTFVYRPENDSFYFVYIHYENEEIVIKHVPETDGVFQLLKNFDSKDQFDEFDAYFNEVFPTLTNATKNDVGFEFLSDDQFKYGVWWCIASAFYDTRSELKREVRTYKTKRHVNKQEQFFAKYADKPLNLHYEDGKVYVILDGNVKKEILL